MMTKRVKMYSNELSFHIIIQFFSLNLDLSLNIITFQEVWIMGFLEKDNLGKSWIQ